MIIHNDIDADEDDDNEEDDDEPSVPLEQYRAWLGTFQLKQHLVQIFLSKNNYNCWP